MLLLCSIALPCTFSVIIPFFNNNATLERAINSVTPQLSADSELILINDGSTDGSSLVVKTNSCFQAFKYFELDYNRGTLFARSFGSNKAVCEYVVFLDADDEVDAHLLENLKQFLQNSEKVDVVYFNMVLKKPGVALHVIADISPTNRWNGIYQGNNLTEKLISSGNKFFTFCGKAVRTNLVKTAVQKLGKFVNFKIVLGEDLLLWSLILQQNPLVLGFDFDGYFNHENSQSTTKITDRLLDEHYINRKLQDYQARYWAINIFKSYDYRFASLIWWNGSPDQSLSCGAYESLVFFWQFAIFNFDEAFYNYSLSYRHQIQDCGKQGFKFAFVAEKTQFYHLNFQNQDGQSNIQDVFLEIDEFQQWKESLKPVSHELVQQWGNREILYIFQNQYEIGRGEIVASIETKKLINFIEKLNLNDKIVIVFDKVLATHLRSKCPGTVVYQVSLQSRFTFYGRMLRDYDVESAQFFGNRQEADEMWFWLKGLRTAYNQV